MSRHRRDAILAYTDGACSGNPGPSGIGVVLVCGHHRREISEYLGEGTSNIAEVMAVVRALEAIKDRTRDVLVHSDSQYTIGVLTQNWKLRANKELVEHARALASTFPRLKFTWVPGHAGVAENERCDVLAKAAVRARGPRVASDCAVALALPLDLGPRA